MILKNVYDLGSMLKYCTEHLGWAIDEEYFEDIDDITFDFYPEDLGLKDDAFAKIRSLKQVRPFVDNQPWGIFALDFESKKMEVSALRKILYALIPKKRGVEHKTWACENLLFLCFWGESTYRTVGFVSFEQKEGNGLPTIKPLYCTPRIEERDVLESFEHRIQGLAWPHNYQNNSWVDAWRDVFRIQYGQVVRDTKRLTEHLANIALKICKNLEEGFATEIQTGSVHQLYRRFNKALNISLTTKEFIDMYAQTIVYGLFCARCMKPELVRFTPADAVACVPATNPLLKELLFECCQKSDNNHYDELDVLELIDLLNSVDMSNILSDFNRQTGMGKEDPIVYFYEGFLDIYEKEQKKRRGVYYTPMPVVNFMVDAVDHILRSEFGCSNGYLSENVSILDPAAGTGTYLRKIILKMSDEFRRSKHTETWSEYVQRSLLSRLFGFELMMAPYAVAHMKLAMTLRETGYDFASNKRLQVYLANSLENSKKSPAPTEFADPLVRESSYAASVKRRDINVIIGNPPYRTDSINKGDWIMGLMRDYKKEPGTNQRLQERNPKVVNEDSVKFLRFAQEILKGRDQAVIAFIHPHSYMDNLTFRGMRWNLLQNFAAIYTVDLHGNVMSRERFDIAERDENVFDIQQGVCISFFVKSPKHKGPARVFYSDVCGSRMHKYEYLNRTAFAALAWNEIIPTAPYYFIKPKNLSNASSYDNGVKISELFPLGLGGIKTHDDATLVSDNVFTTGHDQLYDYRPFDTRHLDYDLDKVERPRFEVMQHFIDHENIGIVINRQVVTDNWSHIQMVNHMIDNRLHYSRKGIPVLCPLYLYDKAGLRQSNINMDYVRQFEKKVGMKFAEKADDDHFTVVTVADYCYAVLHSDSYRIAYRDLLSIDFPRIPYPEGKGLFLQLATKGENLRKLHTMKEDIPNNVGIVFQGIGNGEITKVEYSDGKICINRTQCFANVSKELWDFPFGGYRSLQKWFKDRKHHILTETDIAHVIKVFNILNQTAIVMSEIDELYVQHGIAFRCD
jgi:predicted helicase